jgi:hypothetical protein
MHDLETLAEIFNNRIFRIPDYQRGYAWGAEQLGQFWEDLENLDLGRVGYHYTGVLTLEPISEGDVKSSEKWQEDSWILERGYKPFYVIDGQQRLTTIIILVKVILDRFNENETINFYEKKDIQKKILYEEVGDYRSFIFGYEKDSPSEAYFRAEILDQSPRTDGSLRETLYTANLKNARVFFEKKTESLAKKELEALLRKILNALKFHAYEVDDEFDVFLRFETINNRGKTLSELELLKNRLIYLTTLLPDTQSGKVGLRAYINDVWKTVYEYLGKNKDNPLNDGDFLQNHWLMHFRHDEPSPQGCLHFLLNQYFVAKNVLGNPSEAILGHNEIEAYVESLSRSASKWFYMFNPAFSSYGKKTIEWLERINRHGFGGFKPLVMAALVKDVGEQKLNELLQAVNRFQFTRYRLILPQSRSTEKRYYRMASLLFHGQDAWMIDEIIKDIKLQKDREISSLFHVGRSDLSFPSMV